MTTTLAPEWTTWIEENLRRKVPEATLREVLARRNFAPDVIDRIFAAKRPDPSAPRRRQILPPGPDWVRWVRANAAHDVPPQLLADYAASEINNIYAHHLEELKTRPPGPRYDYDDSAPSWGTTIEAGGREIEVIMEVKQPRIALLRNVLSNDECDAIINLAKSRIRRSTTVDNTTGKFIERPERTSSGMFIAKGETELIAQLESRFAAIMRCPVARGESLQVVNYQAGGQYVPHFDFFAPGHPGSREAMAHGGQRVATMILYLNDVEEGGETTFPRLNLNIKPVKGNALYFHYTNRKGELDHATLHAGSAVIKGEKWIATKWVRQQDVETKPQ